MVANPSGTRTPEGRQVADHLAQRGVLAADLLEVAQADVGEGPDVRGSTFWSFIVGSSVGWCSVRSVNAWSAGVCRMIVEISSTDLVEESTTGRWCRLNIASVRRSSKVHCSSEAYWESRAALLAHGREPRRRGHQPEALVAQVAHRPGELDDLEVLLDDRVVRDEQAVLQREVHRGRRLAAPRRRHQDHVGLLEAPHALPVVVLDGVLDRLHPAVVALDVADAVQPGGQPLAVACRRIDSTRCMCRSKKSIIGQRVRVQLQAHLVARRGGEHQRRARARVQRLRRAGPPPRAPPRPRR